MIFRLLAHYQRHSPGAISGPSSQPDFTPLKSRLEASQKHVGELTGKWIQTESVRKEEAHLLTADVSEIHRANLLSPDDRKAIESMVTRLEVPGYVPSKGEIQVLNAVVQNALERLKGPQATVYTPTSVQEKNNHAILQLRLAVTSPPLTLGNIDRAHRQATEQIKALDEQVGQLAAKLPDLKQRSQVLEQGLKEKHLNPFLMSESELGRNLELLAIRNELQQIRQQMTDIKQQTGALTALKVDLQDKMGILKPEEDKLGRPHEVNLSLTNIREIRDSLAAQSEKFQLSFSDRLFGRIDSASVKTLGRVQVIREELNGSMDRLHTEVTRLQREYQTHGGSPRSLELLNNCAEALEDLNPKNAPLRLQKLQRDHARLEESLSLEVRQGKLPDSEKKLLLTLSSNIQKGIQSYREGMDKATERETKIQAELDAASPDKPEAIKYELQILTENQNRIQNLQEALKSPLVIDSNHIDSIKKRASDMRQEMMVDLKALHQEFAKTNATPEVLTMISMQIDKLKYMDDPDALASIGAHEQDLQKHLTPADKTSLQDIQVVIDRTIEKYQGFTASVAQKEKALEDNTQRLNNLTEAVTEATRTAGSGKSTAYSLQISVATPVPGLSVTGRVGTNFTLQRNAETGMIEVINQFEGGLGVQGKLAPKNAVGGEIYGGRQTKFTFGKAEDAARFLHFVETGHPADFKVPTPTRVAYGGLKGQIQGELPNAFSAKGEVSVQFQSERKPNGDEVSLLKGTLKGAFEYKLLGDPTNVYSADVAITHKHKTTTTFRNDAQERTKTVNITEVEMALGLSVNVASLAIDLKLDEEQTEKLRECIEAHKLQERNQASGQSNVLLKVEFEGGKPVALSVGVQTKITTQVGAADVAGFGFQASRSQEIHQFKSLWLSHGSQGQERLETYFMADPKLYQQTKKELGWEDTMEFEIEGHGQQPQKVTLASLEHEWTTKKKEQDELKTLKELFLNDSAKFHEKVQEMKTGPPAKTELEFQGRKLEEFEAIWAVDKGDRETLERLKVGFMADRSMFKRTYAAQVEGNSLNSDSILDGKRLSQHEYEWSRDYDRQEQRRALSRQQETLRA